MAKVAESDLSQRQGARIRLLREHQRRSKPLLADRLGFRSSQTYELYERGVSVIRVDQLDTWAAAFDVSREDFIDILTGKLDPREQWTFRDALKGRILEEDIEDLAPQWEGKPILNQKSAVEAILQMAEEQRRRATDSSRKSNAH